MKRIHEENQPKVDDLNQQIAQMNTQINDLREFEERRVEKQDTANFWR